MRRQEGMRILVDGANQYNHGHRNCDKVTTAATLQVVGL